MARSQAPAWERHFAQSSALVSEKEELAAKIPVISSTFMKLRANKISVISKLLIFLGFSEQPAFFAQFFLKKKSLAFVYDS